MKNIIILMFILLPASQIFAQVTLTSSNNPTAGNIQWLVDSDTNGITQGNAGPNQTWNFTSLVRGDSSLLTFISSGSTPYAGQFSSSNVASTNDNLNFNYFGTSSASLFANGHAGPGAVIPYTNPELFMQYPFTYNSSFNDNFSANYPLNGTTVYRTGTINVTGDAWGTINLPFGAFTNALRVKYIISTKDSSNPGMPFVITMNLTSYVWFVPGRKFPVFEIIYTDIIINDMPQAVTKSINYNSNSTPIGITPISSNVPEKFTLSQNYPNPFNPETKIKFDISKQGLTELKVFDITGKEIGILVNEELNAGTYEVGFNAGEFPSGVYLYRIVTGNFSQTKKMILIK